MEKVYKDYFEVEKATRLYMEENNLIQLHYKTIKVNDGYTIKIIEEEKEI